MLPRDATAAYDYGRDPEVAEALMNESEAKSIAEVAATLRAEIIAGDYAGGKVPSRVRIASRFRISPESGGVVLRMLTTEGLIRMEQGRGTFAEPVLPFWASVAVRRTSGLFTSEEFEKARDRIGAAGEAGLSVEAVRPGPEGTVVVMLAVIARDAGYAGTRASAIVRAAFGDGWEITGTSTEARPA